MSHILAIVIKQLRIFLLTSASLGLATCCVLMSPLYDLSRATISAYNALLSRSHCTLFYLGFTITMVKTIVFVSIIIIIFLSFFANEVYRTDMTHIPLIDLITLTHFQRP